jgi:hypothetical protein
MQTFTSRNTVFKIKKGHAMYNFILKKAYIISLAQWLQEKKTIINEKGKCKKNT